MNKLSNKVISFSTKSGSEYLLKCNNNKKTLVMTRVGSDGFRRLVDGNGTTVIGDFVLKLDAPAVFNLKRNNDSEELFLYLTSPVTKINDPSEPS